MNSGTPIAQSRSQRWLTVWFALATVAYTMAAVVAMMVLSPRVPYADAWRHYARLLGTPFPGSVLKAENGHPEVVANLVRLADLLWLHGDERWQIGFGIVLALATFGVGLASVLRAAASPLVRSAAACALSLGIFWLGNARALAHDNETLHVYSVLLCTFAAIALLLKRDDGYAPSSRAVAAAAALCFFASFNFGSGIASFVGLFAVLFMQRAPLRQHIVGAAGLALTLACYRALDGSGGVPLRLQPFADAVLALRWIASPLIYLFWPLVDPVAAAALPGPFGAAAGAVARRWTEVFGDVRISVFPHVVFGAAFFVVTLLATLRTRARHHAGERIVRFGLALAWFGLGVAAMVAVSRGGYFVEQPSQVYAPRYLPWPSLAWAGLLMAWVGQASARRQAYTVALAVSVLALAAEGGMSLVMRHQREVAEDIALAAVLGVWPGESAIGEVSTVDTRDGAQALRRQETGPFAWPEARWLQRPVPADASERSGAVLIMPPREGGSDEGVLRLEANGVAAACHQRLLVVDRGRVVGLLRPLGGGHWRGVARAETNAPLQLFELACR